MILISKLSSNNTISRSLKATVPLKIVLALKLENKGNLVWHLYNDSEGKTKVELMSEKQLEELVS